MPIITCPKCGAKNRVDERGQKLQAVCGRCGGKLVAGAAEPLHVTDATFERDVLRAEVPVLLDCWAPWCGPCRMIAPTVDKLAAGAGGRYVVGKLNVDENPAVANRFQISSIPTMLIFEGGRVVEQIVGLQPQAAIEKKIAAHL